MPRRGLSAVSAGMIAGVVVDALVVDPIRGHPVAAFGIVAADVEKLTWRPTRSAGALHVVATTLPVVLVARAVHHRLSHRPVVAFAYATLLTWTVLGAAGLRRAAHDVERALATGDLDAARHRLRSLCGREASQLDEAALRRAVIESVAENTSDAAVAPLVWGVLAGPAGLAGYRVVNTLDAMVGERSERYERFGYAAARLDDLANLLPSRLTAALATVLAGTVGGRPREAFAVWRRDAGAHPSPNAGPCEAAFAGALGLRLGGPIVYPYGASARPWLGDGHAAPTSADVDRAVALSRHVVAVAALLCAAVEVGRWGR